MQLTVRQVQLKEAKSQISNQKTSWKLNIAKEDKKEAKAADFKELKKI